MPDERYVRLIKNLNSNTRYYKLAQIMWNFLYHTTASINGIISALAGGTLLASLAEIYNRTWILISGILASLPIIIVVLDKIFQFKLKMDATKWCITSIQILMNKINRHKIDDLKQLDYDFFFNALEEIILTHRKIRLGEYTNKLFPEVWNKK